MGGYRYENLRPELFTEEGVKMLRAVEQEARRLCGLAGVVRADRTWRRVTGDAWMVLACLDYLVETKTLREVTGSERAGQHRVFELVEVSS